MVLFFTVTLPYLLFIKILKRSDPEAAEDRAFRAVKVLLKGIFIISGASVDVQGLENIPEGEAVLFIGNHRSFFDVIISYTLMNKNVCYIGKQEFDRIPVFRQWVKEIRALMLNRSNPKEGLKTIIEAIDRIKHGTSVFIYPEGTRSRGEDASEMLEFHEGSFKIAKKTGCRVVPVVAYDTSVILERHFPVIKPEHVSMVFMEPVDLETIPEEFSKKPSLYVHELMRQKLIEMSGKAEVKA